MTTAPGTATADVEISAPPAGHALQPYAQLVRMLVPSAGCVSVYDADGELRFSSDGFERPDLREVVDALGAVANGSARASVWTTAAGMTAFGACLRDTDETVLGYLVIELKSDRAHALATNLLAPLVECLTSGLRAERRAASGPAPELAPIELDLLIDASEIDVDGPEALRRLLERCLTTLDCETAAFVSRDRELTVIVERGSDAPAANTDIIERTRRHLLAWAQLNNRPMVVNRVGATAGAQPFKILSCPVRGHDDDIAGLLALFRTSAAPNFEDRDVHLLEFLCRRVVGLLTAGIDALTGLATRPVFEATLGPAEGPGEPGALLQIGIDRLQTINDAFGLDAGDSLIRIVAERLRVVAGGATPAGRLSGDRFGVFLPGADTQAATVVAGRVLDACSEAALELGGESVPVSVSIGIATNDSGEPRRTLLAAADAAAVQARRAGGNRYVVYHREPLRSALEARELVAAARLRDALGANQFVLLAQPIVAFESPDRLAGCELLIRLPDATGALLAPDRFLSVARRYGLSLGVDTWVFSELVRQLGMHSIRATGLPIGLAVNVSAQALTSPTYANTVVAEIASAPLPADTFSFEIAEGAAMAHLDEAETFIDRIRGCGARVALGGFGSGLTSLAQLRRLRVDYLKVDGELVRGIAADRHLESMVFGLAKAAESLELATVAEHVENEVTADKLRAMGFDYGQGYFFGRPATLESVLDGEPARL